MKQGAERGLLAEDADHLGLAHPHDLAVAHRRGRRQPQRLPNQASFTEEFARAEHGDDRLLALLGGDDDLDLALLDVMDSIRRPGLSIDDGILGVLGDGAPTGHRCQEGLRIEARFSRCCHKSLLIVGARPSAR
jgi:hypothetical protein